MINKTIFKQTLKSNFKIWFIFTIVLIVFNVVLIAVFDPKTITNVTDLLKDTPLSSLLGMTTFLGMLAQTFYGLHGVLLPLVFIIITANSLIVSQVDKGSMAYTLSTPVKRSVVVRTQAFYFITSVFVMILCVTISGLISIQAFQGGVWGKGYTEDVKATSKVLNVDEEDIENNLSLILNNEKALKTGAGSRNLEVDVYTAYLNLKIADDKNAEPSEEMQKKFMSGLKAAAKVLGIDESELTSDMGKIKESKEALNAAVTASEIPEKAYLNGINNQLASLEINKDKGIDFSLKNYIMLNLGLFLLMFATSSISFLFSCIFNLTKNYMAIGAGLPFAFYIFKLMGQTSSDLEIFKYLSLNSLFDTDTILNGGNYLFEFIVMAAIGVVLYTLSISIFKKKDLPL